jgi:predicted Zn-dependent protease with MMP-like domain
MPREEFEKLVAEEFPHAIPEKFRDQVRNVAFLIEEQPSMRLRMAQKLSPYETLLGFYHGLPRTVRGDNYGVGATLPDTITLFQIPIQNKAMQESALGGLPPLDSLRKVIRDTIWHEVAHHFGMNERTVRTKEQLRKAKK